MLGISHQMHPTGLFAVLAVTAFTPAFCQQPLGFPSWLKSFPGAAVAVRTSESSIESSYAASAQPPEVVEYYRRLLETTGLAFHPNDDGIGASIRAEAPECDLLIQIRSRADGTLVNVYCSAKSATSPSSSPDDIKVISVQPRAQRIGTAGVKPAGPPPPVRRMSAEDWMQMHQQKVAEMGLHREHPDAPAPPLVWPPWLVNVSGAAARPERSPDQAKNVHLRARYTSTVPMTKIYHFYQDLLKSHEYQTRSSMSTGQTMSGVKQNALGYVEGSNYPDGAPGARTEIKVSFSRDVLNGPIEVIMYFSTHEYIAKRGY